jgi:hypothetical protein
MTLRMFLRSIGKVKHGQVRRAVASGSANRYMCYMIVQLLSSVPHTNKLPSHMTLLVGFVDALLAEVDPPSALRSTMQSSVCCCCCCFKGSGPPSFDEPASVSGVLVRGKDASAPSFALFVGGGDRRLVEPSAAFDVCLSDDPFKGIVVIRPLLLTFAMGVDKVDAEADVAILLLLPKAGDDDVYGPDADAAGVRMVVLLFRGVDIAVDDSKRPDETTTGDDSGACKLVEAVAAANDEAAGLVNTRSAVSLKSCDTLALSLADVSM